MAAERGGCACRQLGDSATLDQTGVKITPLIVNLTNNDKRE